MSPEEFRSAGRQGEAEIALNGTSSALYRELQLQNRRFEIFFVVFSKVLWRFLES